VTPPRSAFDDEATPVTPAAGSPRAARGVTQVDAEKQSVRTEQSTSNPGGRRDFDDHRTELDGLTELEQQELERTVSSLLRDHSEQEVSWALQIVGDGRVDAAAAGRAAVYLRERAAGTGARAAMAAARRAAGPRRGAAPVRRAPALRRLRSRAV
jgi:hypothetical protein